MRPTPPRVFRGWRIPGPVPPGGVAPDEDESLDALSGHWRIFQKKKGHRYSTDDVLCAYYGSQWAPRIDRYCDLGSGIGSVAMMVAWRRPGCSVVTLEAQEVSRALMLKSLRHNGIEDRFTSLLGDLRETSVREHGPFDLVTGSPPYWAEGSALPTEAAQSVHARIETRGTVADYTRAAAAILAPGGVFACVFQAGHEDKVHAAHDAADLVLVRHRRVIFKEGKPGGAYLTLAQRRGDLPALAPIEEPPLTIRTASGDIDLEYSGIKLSMGLPP